MQAVRERRLRLPHDLQAPARFTWRHAIPARKTDPGPAGRVPRGRRVSVTLRTVR
ncbi:hypothetical protein GCM10009527_094560 [Actinomadura nitritigenes]